MKTLLPVMSLIISSSTFAYHSSNQIDQPGGQDQEYLQKKRLIRQIQYQEDNKEYHQELQKCQRARDEQEMRQQKQEKK